MTRTFRKPRRSVFTLETLDDRCLPSAAAALAAHQLAVEERLMHREQVIAAHLAAVEAQKAARAAILEAKAAKLTPTVKTVKIAVPAQTQAQIRAAAATYSSNSSSSTTSTAPPVASTSTAVPVTTAATTTTGAAVASNTTPTVSAVSGSALPGFTSTSTDVSDVQNGPLAKGGQKLVSLYQEYETFIANGGTPSQFTSSMASTLNIQGGSVVVDLSAAGDLTSYISQVEALGMTVQHTDANLGIVEGTLPIDQLVAVAQLDTTASISPVFVPILSTGLIR